MPKGKFYLATLFIWGLTSLSFSATKTEKNAEVVARVNQVPIYLEEFSKKLSELKIDISALDQAIEKKIVNDLINEKLVEQKASQMTLKSDKDFQKTKL